MRKMAAPAALFLFAGLVRAQSAPQPIGDLVASQASVHGSVMVAGGETSLLSGATVDAGASPAEIRLRRGGRLQVCPHTTLTLNLAGFRSADQTAPQFGGLMFSMGAGALELDYSLPAQAPGPASIQISSADSIVTPDFRLLFAAPATVHLAVSVDGAGDTCIRALAGNTANVMVGELMGTGAYLLKPSDAVEFAGGNIANAHLPAGACGCATSAAGAGAQAAASASPDQAGSSGSNGGTAPAASHERGSAVQDRAVPPLAANPAAAKPNQAPVEVEAPFVFSGGAPALPVAKVAAIRPRSNQNYPSPVALPPPRPAAAKPRTSKHRGFFSRIGGFFAHLFGKHSK